MRGYSESFSVSAVDPPPAMQREPCQLMAVTVWIIFNAFTSAGSWSFVLTKDLPIVKLKSFCQTLSSKRHRKILDLYRAKKGPHTVINKREDDLTPTG